MKIKVCGIRTKSNLEFLSAQEVDFVGFIFYSKSKRNFENGELGITEVADCGKHTVGVFVNESAETIKQIVAAYQLDYVQMHGDETPGFCESLKLEGIKIIKAFSVIDQLPQNLGAYEPYVDYFLFDTKGQSYGGNGVQFNWQLLGQYVGETPFFLSGGIGPEDVDKVTQMDHPGLVAIDVNSCFESAPGLKDEDLLRKFIDEFKRKERDGN
ncbi:MAG: phosphoribosylanthranilate isomerase [Reichenbachiella sp.]|uniref:phosphoribosylanthranilate isomerase n=1 Tax=Reichenbachiella sp. TaxID=2184521 RepID=UPI00326493A0